METRCTINKGLGFGMCYWDVRNYVGWDACCLFMYLLDKSKTTRRWDGNWFLCSNSFINEYIPWSDNTINKYLTELKEAHLIDVDIRTHGYKKERWIKLTTDFINTKDNPDANTNDNTNNNTKGNTEYNTENLSIIKGINTENLSINNKNKINNNNKDNNIFQKKLPWESNTNNSSTNNKEEYSNIEEYIESTDHSALLMNWYLEHKNTSLKKIKSQYEDICSQCNHDYGMIERSIKDAWHGGYKLFKVPDNYQQPRIQQIAHCTLLDDDTFI